MRNREYREREFKRRARRINERTPLGLILLIVGGALLARQVGVLLPAWLFTWQALLICVGLIIGIVNRFRDLSWLIMIAVGVLFLLDDIYPGTGHYAWPMLIIFVGLVIILRPRRKKDLPPPEVQAKLQDDRGYEGTMSEELDAVAIFAGVKKTVLSKDFRGGEVVAVFGGGEINLTQADFRSPVRLDLVAVFGGVKLIVPANWEIRSEVTAIFGGVDDKRDSMAAQTAEKVVIIDGTAICGGIEIRSY